MFAMLLESRIVATYGKCKVPDIRYLQYISNPYKLSYLCTLPRRFVETAIYKAIQKNIHGFLWPFHNLYFCWHKKIFLTDKHILIICFRGNRIFCTSFLFTQKLEKIICWTILLELNCGAMVSIYTKRNKALCNFTTINHMIVSRRIFQQISI